MQKTYMSVYSTIMLPLSNLSIESSTRCAVEHDSSGSDGICDVTHVCGEYAHAFEACSALSFEERWSGWEGLGCQCQKGDNETWCNELHVCYIMSCQSKKGKSVAVLELQDW